MLFTALYTKTGKCQIDNIILTVYIRNMTKPQTKHFCERNSCLTNTFLLLIYTSFIFKNETPHRINQLLKDISYTLLHFNKESQPQRVINGCVLNKMTEWNFYVHKVVQNLEACTFCSVLIHALIVITQGIGKVSITLKAIFEKKYIFSGKTYRCWPHKTGLN